MLALAPQRPAHRRKNVLALASIGAHVTAALALFGYSLLHVEEIAPPVLALTFLSAPPPPPPPPPPPAGSSKPKQTQPTETKVVTPSKVVDTTEAKPVEKPQESGGVEGGVEGGVKGGTVGGVVGGVIGGAGTDAPKMVASFTLAASQLQHTDPHLPEWFLQQHAAQTVKGVYKVCIGLDGKIASVTAMTAIGAVDDAIMDHIKNNWLYKPQAVPVCTASVLVFKIK